MGADISNLVHKYGHKAKDFKTLYGFRFLLKKRAAEYKKVIGLEVDPEKLKELIWNAMGRKLGSKVQKCRATGQKRETSCGFTPAQVRKHARQCKSGC